eukprot:g29529.t1
MNQQEAQETGDTPSAPIMTPPTSTPRLLNGYWKTLPNWGQTCFANSVLQYITPLVIWMQRLFPTGSWREQPITQLIQRMAVAPDLTAHTDTNTILRLAQVLAIICEEKPGMMTGAIYKQCKPHVPQMRTPTKSTPSSQPGCAHEFLTHILLQLTEGIPTSQPSTDTKGLPVPGTTERLGESDTRERLHPSIQMRTMTEINCHRCHYQSIRHTPSSFPTLRCILPASLSPTNVQLAPVRIETCIRNELAIHKIPDTETYKCDCPEKTRHAISQSSREWLDCIPPDFLNIEVNRIAYDGERRVTSTAGQSINNNLLLVDLNHLDLSAYFSPIYTINREAIYTPISFLLHKGPTTVPTELLHLNIYETITAVLYQRVDLGAETPTGHSTQPLPSHSPFFLPTIPRHSHIPEAPQAYPQWMRGPPITLRAPDVPDVVMTLQASRKRKPTETGSPDRSTPAFWEKLCRGILRDMEKTPIGQATVKFMTRSHLLAQAPDSNGILGYDFGGKSLRPVLVPSLTQEVWDLLRYKTWVPITGALITVYNNNPQDETVLGFHRDDERFMSHDEVINLSFGPTAELRIMPYGQQARAKLDGQALILNNGTFHTFNRFQLHKVSMPPNRPNDPTRRISISFRVFTTWAEIPPPLRPRIAQGNTNLQQTLAAWKAKNQADEPQSDSTGYGIEPLLAARFHDIQGIIDLTLEYIGLHTPQNGRILTVTQTDHIDEGKPLTPPWHPRTIALIQRDEEVRQAIMTNTLMHLRGIHSTMIFQEIVQSTRFKQSDRHHFCVLLYRPEVPIHADLSTSMICPPDSKWAAPTAILFNQAKIRQQVLTTTKDCMFWGPSTRSAAQQAANLRLFHRTQAREECLGTYPRYHIASIKTARQGWFLLIDPQWTNGFLDHVSAMERKILGGSIDQVAPEYRRVVVQRRTPDRPPIGFDYRGDFQWLNQGFWHCGMITQIAHYPEYRSEDPETREGSDLVCISGAVHETLYLMGACTLISEPSQKPTT